MGVTGARVNARAPKPSDFHGIFPRFRRFHTPKRMSVSKRGVHTSIHHEGSAFRAIGAKHRVHRPGQCLGNRGGIGTATQDPKGRETSHSIRIIITWESLQRWDNRHGKKSILKKQLHAIVVRTASNARALRHVRKLRVFFSIARLNYTFFQCSKWTHRESGQYTFAQSARVECKLAHPRAMAPSTGLYVCMYVHLWFLAERNSSPESACFSMHITYCFATRICISHERRKCTPRPYHKVGSFARSLKMR